MYSFSDDDWIQTDQGWNDHNAGQIVNAGDWGKWDPNGSWISRPAPKTTTTAWNAADHENTPDGFMGNRSLARTETEGQSAAWGLAEGFDPFGYRTNQDQIPELADFFNTWNQKHFAQYGTSYNRPWDKHGESALRDDFIGQYTGALSEYNKLYGTNLTPDEQALQRFGVAPTEWAASDPTRFNEKKGMGKFAKIAAPVLLSALGAPYLSGMLGGGLIGNAGAGAIIGGASSGFTGGNVLQGALLGGLGGGASHFLNAGAGTAAGIGDWTSGFDLPMGDTAGLGAAASSGVPSSYWNMMAGDATGVGNMTGGGMGFGDWGTDEFLGDFGVGGTAPSSGSSEFPSFSMGNESYANAFGPSGAEGAFPTIQGGIDQMSQLQPNFGGPGFPTGAGLPDAWAKALSSAGFAAQAGGGSIMDQIQKFMSNPSNLLRGGGALANLLIQNRTAGQLTDAAERSAFMNQTINQPQRAPYQAMLAQQMSNPSEFLSTNPVVRAQLEMAKNQMEANTAKMGAGGKVFGDYLGHMNNVMSDNYYKNADLLSRLGGFNDGAGGAGSAFGNLAGQAAQASGAGFQGFSQFFNPQQQDPQIAQLLKQISDKASEIFL
jgi:hypothetical protein